MSDGDILAWADENDADGDGISGRPNWVSFKDYSTERPGAMEQNGLYVGRFGRKSGAYDLLQQTAQAYNQDIGVVSDFEPIDPYTHEPQDPEVATTVVNDVGVLPAHLEKLRSRNSDDAEVTADEQVFIAVGCAKCHRPEMTTGDSPIAALAHKTFRPFTDLLLHEHGARP